MPSLFTRILQGELPGRFVWKDDRAVALLSTRPLQPGHTLVVPREEIDYWIDLPPDLAAHLLRVATSVARGVHKAFEPRKVGLIVAGLEVPHTHVHLVPIRELRNLDFSKEDKSPDPRGLDEAAERIRKALRELGEKNVSD